MLHSTTTVGTNRTHESLHQTQGSSASDDNAPNVATEPSDGTAPGPTRCAPDRSVCNQLRQRSAVAMCVPTLCACRASVRRQSRRSLLAAVERRGHDLTCGRGTQELNGGLVTFHIVRPREHSHRVNLAAIRVEFGHHQR
jgi:hypothetical protein